jgi:hypothetical protein
MTVRKIKELDVVALTDAEVTKTEEGKQLRVGQVGIVAYMYNQDTFIVEFINKQDESKFAILTLQTNQVLPLLFCRSNQESHQPLSTDLEIGGNELSL